MVCFDKNYIFCLVHVCIIRELPYEKWAIQMSINKDLDLRQWQKQRPCFWKMYKTSLYSGDRNLWLVILTFYKKILISALA